MATEQCFVCRTRLQKRIVGLAAAWRSRASKTNGTFLALATSSSSPPRSHPHPRPYLHLNPTSSHHLRVFLCPLRLSLHTSISLSLSDSMSVSLAKEKECNSRTTNEAQRVLWLAPWGCSCVSDRGGCMHNISSARNVPNVVRNAGKHGLTSRTTTFSTCFQKKKRVVQNCGAPMTKGLKWYIKMHTCHPCDTEYHNAAYSCSVQHRI